MQNYDVSPQTQLHKLLPCISEATIDELIGRGLLHFDDDQWRFGDESNGTTRKLYRNSSWKRADNSGKAWHRLIGLDDVVAHDRLYVLLAIEGSKDALAAAEIANCIDALPVTGIVCALGSGYRPIPPDMHKLAGRRVYVIGDNDKVGHETTNIVSSALQAAGVQHAVWDWQKWPKKVKDLYDALVAYKGKQMPNPFVPKYSLGTFPFAPLPSTGSRVHGFTCSCNDPTCQGTHERGGISDEEKLGIVTPHIMTGRRGTSDDAAALRAIGSRTKTVEGDAAKGATRGRKVLGGGTVPAHSRSGPHRGACCN